MPSTLEMAALRRLKTAAFGTLMAPEPDFALIGLVVLVHVPGGLQVLGVRLVVLTGVGAERTGARDPA